MLHPSRALLGFTCILVAGGPLFAANPGDIVITEIMQNPAAVLDSAGEYFEVHNTTGAPIDLQGWTIRDEDFDSHVIGSSLVVAPLGYVVLCNNPDSMSNGGYTCDYDYGSSWFLANGADEVILEEPVRGTATEIDRVEYDDGTTFPDPNGASMIFAGAMTRGAPIFDDNNVGANWTTSTVRDPSFTGMSGDLGSPGTLGTSGQVPVELIGFSVE